jgi:hypothetical protein
MINTATRAQSTSTMGSIAHPGPYGDHNATMSRDRKKEFSTAVAYEGIDQDVMNGLFAAAHDFAQVEDMHVFGKELTLSEAVAAVRSGENHFDKIVLLVSHGEAACVSEEEALATFGNKRVGEIALTSHGIGQALKTSGRTANFCGRHTGLIPELFIVSPLRCATESALIAFPYYSPDSIYGSTWVCHGACNDGESTSVDDLKSSFPGIDYSLAHDDESDFLSWLNAREETIVAIASTPSWIQSFCDRIEPGRESKDLRAVGIKFTH